VSKSSASFVPRDRKIFYLLLSGFGFFFLDFSGDEFRHAHPNPFHAASWASMAADYSAGTIFAEIHTAQWSRKEV